MKNKIASPQLSEAPPQGRETSRWRKLTTLKPALPAGGLLLVMVVLWLLLPWPVLADLGTAFLQIGVEVEDSRSLAWGDIDSDGDLDLAVGNRNGPVQVYENVNGVLTLDPSNGFGWQSATSLRTMSLAWGDWDGDGDLDLAVGNGDVSQQANQVYENDGNTFVLAWTAPVADQTQSVAWGDWDGDGDLDLAVGNYRTGAAQNLNLVYENEGAVLQLDPGNGLGWQAGASTPTRSVAWGDWDGDGDLDLAVGNDFGFPNQVYENEGDTLQLNPGGGLGWESTELYSTLEVAWGDWDGDGDLDLAVANFDFNSPNQVYENVGGNLAFDPSNGLGWQSPETGFDLFFTSVAWGDWDGDGDLDLAAGRDLRSGARVYENDGGTLNFNLAGDLGWQTTAPISVIDVAWGDVDNDGDLDLATGLVDSGNLVYVNDGGGLRFDPASGFGWAGPSDIASWQVDWGDWNGDGDLDLAVAAEDDPAIPGENPNNRVYENINGDLVLAWQATDTGDTKSMAWGDWDGDGDLDLAAGNESGQANVVYENNGGALQPVWQSTELNNTQSVAWGDWDNDGDLDLAVGNDGQPDQVYENTGATLVLDPANGLGWQSNETNGTLTLAWGDWDDDGDLDLAVGHKAGTLVYENSGGTLTLDLNNGLGWRVDAPNYTSRLAWADYDNDGDLDLALSHSFTDGVSTGPPQVYENENGTLILAPGNGLGWQASISEFAISVSWGDWDGDGDFDLLTDGTVYENEDGTIGAGHPAPPTNRAFNRGASWGDWDNDGDLDVALALDSKGIRVVENTLQDEINLPNPLASIYIAHPGPTPAGAFGSAARAITETVIPVSYTVANPTGNSLGQIRAFYSLNGGGEWFPAVGATPFPTTTAPGAYVFNWDTLASGFFGNSDNVVLRFEAAVQTPARSAGSYQYPNQPPGPNQRAYISARTLPFNVQATQVRVLNGITPVAGALVYRLPAGETVGGAFIGTDMAFVTDQNGFLQGRGQIELGDRLLALAPVDLPLEAQELYSTTLSLYYTNGNPTETGLDAFTVTTAGVQELVVSADNPLMLFDLDVSVEWDASQDSTYLAQLEFDLKRASEFLYDFTDGQVALGDIWVYQNADVWAGSHINIHATNRLRPYATLGGVVLTDTGHIIPELSDISYGIGQVHMGSTWNRYGNPGESLGVDWPVILAHELGHYLLFLEDTYLGLEAFDGAEVLTSVNSCLGSGMGDVYNINNTEFVFDDTVWNNNCLDTLAQQELGRDEWEIVTSWYPWLQTPTAVNSGPSLMPFELTTVSLFTPLTPTNVLDDPTFYLDYANNEIGSSEARAFLLRNRDNEVGNPATTDDYEYVYDLGNPVGGQNRLLARGAQPGDRLCVFDGARNQFGCEIISLGDERLTLAQDPTWTPVIRISPVNSTTFTLEVDGLAAGLNLKARLYPEFGEAFPVSPVLTYNDGLYNATLNLDYAALNGNVQLWVDEGPDGPPYINPRRETIVTYRIGGNPGNARGGGGNARGGGGNARGGGGNARGGGGNARGGGGNARGGGANVLGEGGAPAVSPDGQMTYFDRNFNLAEGEFYTIQDMAGLPDLPDDKIAIGRGYNLFATGFSVTNPLTGSISFQYRGNDVLVEEKSEEELGIHFWDGSQWLALNTRLDTTFNLASARSQGPGIYALLAGVTRPAITSVTPASATNDGDTTLVIEGGYFLPPVEVILTGPNETFILAVQSVSPDTVTALVPAGLPAREYRVQVSNSNQPGGAALSLTPGSFALFDPAQACFYDFFESGAGQWQREGDWDIVITPDGNRAMTDSPLGPYKNADDYGAGLTSFTTHITSQPFTLNAACPTPVLRFRHDFILANLNGNQDVARIEISTDGGNSWTELRSYSGGGVFDNLAGQDVSASEWATANWRNVAVDLRAYSGPVQLRFSLEVNDDAVAAKGWVIDDVVVAEAQAPLCRLYGIHDQQNDSQFFAIDTTNNILSPLGPVYAGDSLKAMDVDPITGQFYTVRRNPDSENSELYRVDPATGELTTLVGIIQRRQGQAFKGVQSLSFHADGSLWGYAQAGPPARRGIIQIDPTTAEATLVRRDDRPVGGLAWSTDGSKLWLTAGQDLFRYDPAANSIRFERTFVALTGNANGLDARTDGLLVTALQSGGSLDLYTLDPNTGHVELLDAFTASGFGNIEALVWPESCSVDALSVAPPPLPQDWTLYLPVILSND